MKNILITGVTRGLGLVIAKQLIQEGCVVWGIGRNENEETSNLKKKFSDQFNFLSFDLNNISEIKKEIFSSFITGKLPIHGLVNNAAWAYDELATNFNHKNLEQSFNVNVVAAVLITKYVIRNMILHHTKGSLVHISSICAHTGYKGLSAYAATKGAIESFSKNISREWGGQGIRSNCVVPGFMETDMSSGLSAEQKEKIYKRTSLKISTNINSVSETVSFLLSDKSSSITGQSLMVDSGTI